MHKQENMHIKCWNFPCTTTSVQQARVITPPNLQKAKTGASSYDSKAAVRYPRSIARDLWGIQEVARRVEERNTKELLNGKEEANV